MVTGREMAEHVKTWGHAQCPYEAGQGGPRLQPQTMGPRGSLARTLNPRFSEIPYPKILRREQKRKIPDVNLWLPHICIKTCTLICTHRYTHMHTQLLDVQV